MARQKTLMHSPNQLYAGISLLKIIAATPTYSGHQKKVFLLPLYHISLTKADKNCGHLDGVRGGMHR